MKLTAIRHMCSDGLCTLGDVLQERGISYEYIDSYKYGEDLQVYDPLNPEPLIVLGGACGAYQEEDYPFLTQELKLLEKRLAADLPTLGICLGAQLIAKALGADVHPGTKGPEIGWVDLSINEAGQKSPLRHFDQSKTKMLQWHGDTFELAEGMTLLGSSNKYENQAFSYGRNVMGVQFHPEIRACTLEGWYVGSAAAVAKGEINLKQIRKDSAENIATLVQQSRLFFGEWLDNISQQ